VLVGRGILEGDHESDPVSPPRRLTRHLGNAGVGPRHTRHRGLAGGPILLSSLAGLDRADGADVEVTFARLRAAPVLHGRGSHRTQELLDAHDLHLSPKKVGVVCRLPVVDR
jgi:hypothetical protein